MTPLLVAVPMGDEASWEASEIRSDLSGRSVDALDIAECRLNRAQLTLVTLDRCRIRDSLFADCEATGASLEAVSLARVELRRGRLNGAILSRGHAAGRLLRRVPDEGDPTSGG